MGGDDLTGIHMKMVVTLLLAHLSLCLVIITTTTLIHPYSCQFIAVAGVPLGALGVVILRQAIKYGMGNMENRHKENIQYNGK